MRGTYVPSFREALTFVPRSPAMRPSRSFRHVLRDEDCLLVFERLGYTVAPAVSDGLGHGIRENLLFASFEAIEDGHCDGLGRSFREIDAPGHIGIDWSGQAGMNGHVLVGQERSQRLSHAERGCLRNGI